MGLALAKVYNDREDSMKTITLYCDGTYYSIAPTMKSIRIHGIEFEFLRDQNTMRYTYPEGDRIEFSIGAGELFIDVTETHKGSGLTKSREYPWSNAFQKIIVRFH
jgi:hypothetical protein